MRFVFPHRQVAKLLCRKGSAWLLASLDMEHCYSTGLGPKSDPVALQSGSPHWQPRGGDRVGQLAWSCTDDHRGEPGCSLSLTVVLEMRETIGVAPPRVQAPLSLFRVDQALRKEFWPFHIVPLLNVSFCIIYMNQEQISQAFFLCD